MRGCLGARWRGAPGAGTPPLPLLLVLKELQAPCEERKEKPRCTVYKEAVKMELLLFNATAAPYPTTALGTSTTITFRLPKPGAATAGSQHKPLSPGIPSRDPWRGPAPPPKKTGRVTPGGQREPGGCPPPPPVPC